MLKLVLVSTSAASLLFLSAELVLGDSPVTEMSVVRKSSYLSALVEATSRLSQMDLISAGDNRLCSTREKYRFKCHKSVDMTRLSCLRNVYMRLSVKLSAGSSECRDSPASSSTGGLSITAKVRFSSTALTGPLNGMPFLRSCSRLKATRSIPFSCFLDG